VEEGKMAETIWRTVFCYNTTSSLVDSLATQRRVAYLKLSQYASANCSY